MYKIRQMVILKYSQLIANNRCVQFAILRTILRITSC
jgi:hypothetical protein